MHAVSGKAYIDKFFERFARRFPGEAGKGINYFFSDELSFRLQYPIWNDAFAREFSKRKGYDIRPHLPALFVDTGPETPRIRLDYNDVMVALSEEHFFRPLYQWHEDRGMTFGCDHGGRGKMWPSSATTSARSGGTRGRGVISPGWSRISSRTRWPRPLRICTSGRAYGLKASTAAGGGPARPILPMRRSAIS